MSEDKPTLLDWLGLRRELDYSKAGWLGGLISVIVICGLVIFGGLIVFQFFMAVTGLGDFGDADMQSAAIRNIGLVLAAAIGVPFLVWRTAVAQKQVNVASEALFNDKINAAAGDLHARRLVTKNPDDGDGHWDFWQDDIIKRNAAIDRLEGLVRENPETAERIARMLGIYVRELSREHKPEVAPDGATPDEVGDWARKLDACRSDMENAAQTLGRLRGIEGVEAAKVPIDLRGANLQGFDLHAASFADARLEGAEMQGAVLWGAEMQGADLSGAEMQGAVLWGAEMQGAVLDWAKMRRADLSRAEMQGAVLDWAEMRRADLDWAKMRRADLDWAEMQGADLSGAEMDSATSLRQATFQAACLREVDYTDVNISQAQVDDLFYDGTVRFASGIIRAAGREEELDWQDFNRQWRAWQEEIGFVYE